LAPTCEKSLSDSQDTQLTHLFGGAKKQTKRSDDKIDRSSEIMAQLLASSIITWIWIGTFCFTATAPLIAGEFIAFSQSLSLSLSLLCRPTLRNRQHGGF
jgi:hypothetical protein